MNAVERFLQYVGFDTQSDEESESFPSADREKLLAAALAEELRELGLADAHVDEWGYVYAHLAAAPGYEAVPPLGLIAHMDTSPDAPGAPVRPRLVRYTSGALPLDPEGRIAIDPETLAPYAGQVLIVTDGATLLGADDKAGVAEIVSAVERLRLIRWMAGPWGNWSMKTLTRPRPACSSGASIFTPAKPKTRCATPFCWPRNL